MPAFWSDTLLVAAIESAISFDICGLLGETQKQSTAERSKTY